MFAKQIIHRARCIVGAPHVFALFNAQVDVYFVL